MFTIADPIFNPSSPSAAGFRVGGVGRYASLSPTLKPNSEPIALNLSGIVVNSLGIATLPLSTELAPQAIEIEGKFYRYTLSNPPERGNFTTDGEQLIIALAPGFTPKAIALYGQELSIPTDFVPPPYPDLFTQFPLTGEMSWTLTFEEQPSGNFTFITLASQREEVINYFTRRDRLIIYGVGFACSGQISVTEISLTKSAVPLIEVSVNLTGYHAKFLDRYAAIGKSQYLEDCTAPPTLWGNSPETMTLQEFAAQVGASVSGGGIQIPRDLLTGARSLTSLGSQLNEAAVRSAGGYLDFNNPGAIVVSGRGTATVNRGSGHFIRQIRSDVQTSINRPDNGYYRTYNPLYRVTYGSALTTAPNTGVPKPQWQPKPPEITTTEEGDPQPWIDPYFPPNRDLSIVFDISGRRKRYKKITLKNGQPIEEEEEEWGWVAVAKFHMEFTGGTSPTVRRIVGNWQRIMFKYTSYNYDSKGYLEDVVTRGWQLARFQSENPKKPETLSIRLAGNPQTPEDFSAINLLRSYSFFWMPISKIEFYDLELMSRHYKDVKPPMIEYQFCLPNGIKETKPIPDPSWVPPYFVKRKVVREDNLRVMNNPKSTALKPLPPLTTGKRVEIVERVNIGDPVGKKDPTHYTRSVSRYSAQESQFGNYLDLGESEIIAGRPPNAPQMEKILDNKVEPPTNGPRDERRPFFISSGGTGEVNTSAAVSTLDYPNAENQGQALAAAKLALDLANFKNASVEQFTCEFSPTIRPGDRVSYRVNGQTRSRRVISISHRLKIDGFNGSVPLVSCSGSELRVGEDISAPTVFVAEER